MFMIQACSLKVHFNGRDQSTFSLRIVLKTHDMWWLFNFLVGWDDKLVIDFIILIILINFCIRPIHKEDLKQCYVVPSKREFLSRSLDI